MTNLTAEQFLAQVKMVADANDISLEHLEFQVSSGMNCSWYPSDNEDQEDALWGDISAQIAGGTQQ